MSVTPPMKPSLFFIKHAPLLTAVAFHFLMQHTLLYLVKNVVSNFFRIAVCF